MMFFAFAFGMILSNLLHTQSQNKVGSVQQEVLFLYRGIEKTDQDIVESDRKKLSEIHNQKVRLIENAALRQYFLEESQKQNLSVDEVALKLLEWEEVTDSEINQFYQQNQDSIKKPFFEVKSEIKQGLQSRKMNKARQELLEKLRVKGNLIVLPEIVSNIVE